MLSHQPVSTVEFAPLFVRGQRQDQVALGLISFTMQTQKRRHQRGVGVLHVLRATAVKITVLLNELKRIGGPIGAQSLHHVHVAEEKNGLFGRRSGSAETDNEILFALVGPQQVNILRRESRVKEEALHRGCRSGDIALRRVRSVDFDELLEDGQRLRAIGCGCLGRGSLWQMVLCVYK